MFLILTISKTFKKELTNQQVTLSFNQAIKGQEVEPDILDAAYQSLIDGVLDKETGMTKLYNPRFKRPYLCPFTNKKFGNPERLIKSATLQLVDYKRLEKKRKLERMGRTCSSENCFR